MTRWTRALAVSSLTLALAACSSEEPSASTPNPTPTRAPSSAPPPTTTIDGHAGRYLGPVTSTSRQDPPGLLLEPPPADAEPDVSWTEGFAGCVRGLRCVATGDAEVSLALVTGPGDAEIGGRTMFDRTLTFVVTWEAGPCYTMTGEGCRVVNLVTAEVKGNLPAGTALYAFELADGSTTPTA